MLDTDRLNITEILVNYCSMFTPERQFFKNEDKYLRPNFINEVLITLHLVSKASACKAEWAALLLSSFNCELGHNL